MLERLDAAAEEHGINRSSAVAVAIAYWLRSLGRTAGREPDSTE